MVITKPSLNVHGPPTILVSPSRLGLVKGKSFKGWPRVVDAG